MSDKDGTLTGDLGECLKKYVKINGMDGLGVYHDHGQNPTKIKAYWGDALTRSSKLAEPDTAIVINRPEQKQLLILAEIEENCSGPKTVIGDCGSLILSKCIQIGENEELRFSIDGATIVLGLVVEEKGSTKERSKNLVEAMFSRLSGCSKPKTIIPYIGYSKSEMIKKDGARDNLPTWRLFAEMKITSNYLQFIELVVHCLTHKNIHLSQPEPHRMTMERIWKVSSRKRN